MDFAPLRRTLSLTLVALIAALAFATVAVVTAPAPAFAQDDEECPECEFDEEEPIDEEWGDDEGFEDEELFDEEVVALEQATGDLGRAKRAAASKLAKSSSASVLRACTSGGPGWKRIRAIKHRPQRALYAASARRLLADMKQLLDGQQPRIVAYESAYERFVADLRAAEITDETFTAAIAAQARRLTAYRQVRVLKADCKLFNKLTKRVREFPTKTAAQIVRADYRAAPIARKIERHISGQLASIDRRAGITHRDAETLAEAAELMVELGGEQGYATGFQYALSLR
jgi:hypothetical protein